MKKRNAMRILYVFVLTAFLSSLHVYAYEKDASSIVYVSRTGEKYHYVENCSGMKNPIQMTLLEAINRGRTPCKDCVHEYVEQVGGFTDVYSILTPHSEDINWLANTGVSQGWTEQDGSRTFRPFVNVARCDMAAFIRKLASNNNWMDAATWKPSEADWKAFVDVDPSTPHAEDVLWLAHSEISEGWDIGSGKKEFRPYVSVARCDMAAFLYRLASKAGVSDAATWSPTESDWAFTDVNTGSSHVKEVLWLAHSGVSKGWVESDGTKTFRPLQDVARCDMAAFLHRLNDLH